MKNFSHNAPTLLKQNFPNDKAPYKLTFFFIFGLWCRWKFFFMDGYISGKNKDYRKKMVATTTIIKVPLGNSIKQQIFFTSDHASCSMYMMWLHNLIFNYIKAMDTRCFLKIWWQSHYVHCCIVQPATWIAPNIQHMCNPYSYCQTKRQIQLLYPSYWPRPFELFTSVHKS